MEVAAARRAARPGWLNLRTCLGLLLFVIALFTGRWVLAAAEAGHTVWAVASDLSEGTRLTADHLTSVRVDLPARQLAKYLAAEAVIEGATLLRPLRAGELVAASAVTESGLETPLRVVTVPITADHAAGGALRAGDRVDVFASLGAGRPDARTTLLVAGAEVQALVQASGVVMDEESVVAVTLQVSPEEAAKLAFAIRSAEIDIVRVVGPESSPRVGPVTEADL